jgi:hypothetical protein
MSTSLLTAPCSSVAVTEKTYFLRSKRPARGRGRTLIGVSRRRVFLALLLGVIVWCPVFAIASDLLVDWFAPDPNAP